MRVTHVITRLIVGGAQENTIASVLGLRQQRGLEVRLISGPTTGPEGSLQSAVANFEGLFALVPELVRPIHPLWDTVAWFRLRSLFRAQQPDIVHTHSGKAGILGRLAAHHARVPVIVHTIHGPSFGPFQGRAANALFQLAERRAGAVTTHFVTVANAMARQYLAAGIGLPSQYTRVFSGFDLQPFLSARNDPKLRARYGIQPSDFVVGKIARLFKLKGHDDLLAVAPRITEQCPNVKFLLVGDGAWRSRLEARARQLGLHDRFVFVGLVPPAEVAPLIGIMDVVIHLSLREGLARALPQALAAAKPIIAYNCDGADEVCLDGQTGFLVQPGNRDALAGRVLELSLNADLREQLGRQGQALVREWFPVEKMVQDLFALYQRLLAREHR
jgi:glycosyltransferase involved in cell wall biosynthesis